MRSMDELMMYLRIRKEHLESALKQYEGDRTINFPELLAYAEVEAIEEFLSRNRPL